MPKQKKQNRSLVLGLCIGSCLAIVLALVGAAQIHSTNKVKFCASCHEMQTFYKTWVEAGHGLAQKGAMKAKCVDCHLPEEGLLTYLGTKAKAGANDYIAHIIRKKVDWVAKREEREKYTYETGCKKCHKELVAPGIPIKAFLAHRTYELGETDKTCISCHHNVGHGDLLLALNNQQ
ncbi:NapC/NirT family cytochrome c [Desulfohalobiaceae bacterium Ax17]|uniref:cytochrome c3 family protein n=1 Tax=Desulfovulcanus ferrireducens TaxID=2831190 RepID=UPI00207BA95F|nr:NapC/NirT family cytochrome c [Desulfovulcanus ferrireducens]MBT8764308.1 NapC/NirT family cytochrome c [Desulfovulcanus ferrireducens]